MANARHTTPQAASDIDSDYEAQLDDLDDLDDDDDDCFESLDDFGALDELDRMGGFSESTTFDDPPPD
jgi:hypothetical protein